MSSPKDDTTDCIGIPDANENNLLTSDDEESSTNKGLRNLEEDSKNHEKCIMEEVTTEKENESNGDASIEVSLKPENQSGKPIINSELEIASLQKNVADAVQKQSDLEHIEEKENNTDPLCIKPNVATSEIIDEHQNYYTLNASVSEEDKSDSLLEYDDRSLSEEDETRSYNTKTLGCTDEKISEKDLQVLEEHLLPKEEGAVSQSTQVSGGLVDEQNQDIEADYHIPAVQDAPTSTENSVEITGENGDPNSLVDEQNKDFSTGSKMPEVQNAATSTEDSVEVTDASEVQDPNDFADEQNKDSSTGSQNAATSTEVSVEDADEDISPNEQKLPAKQSRRSSEEVTEIISKYLNSEGYIKKLDKIHEFVKHLTSVEFLSPELSSEGLSPEDLETLKELYGQQLEKIATKRKSKLSELDEDPSEDLQAMSKKCKLSNVLDRPINLQSGETSCCLEEQFRLAFKETSDGQNGNSQKDKEYIFPVTTRNEHPRKFCKHQIAKIDAMVASAMSLDNYISQLSGEPDNPNNSAEEVCDEDLSCCGYHSKAQSSSSARTLRDKILSDPQKSVPEKMIADSNEEFSETADKTKWFSYFRFDGALNSIKNLMLCVSFTGSLMAAITIGKVFGVDFPVDKSKRNNTRNNPLQEFPTL